MAESGIPEYRPIAFDRAKQMTPEEESRARAMSREIWDRLMAGLQLPKEQVTGENTSYSSMYATDQQ